MTTDVLDAVADVRPTPNKLSAEWGVAQRHAVLAGILDDRPLTGRVRFVPRRRLAILAPVAASAAVVAVVGSAALLSRSGGSPHHTPPAGPAAGAITPTERVGAGQYTYRADTAYSVDAAGHATVTERNENWTSASGAMWSSRAGGGHTECYAFPAAQPATFQNPDQALFDSMPTDPDTLNNYLRSHVSGSMSRDEAVFVAVGDMLRTSDGLASSQLRAALVQVLGMTDRVTVHQGARDYLGRAAVRADYVDQRNRPGELDSLYFDPQSFQLLEERNGSNGLPATPAPGPSQPYDAEPSGQPPTADELSGAARIDVLTSESVADSLPADVQHCPAG